MVVFPVLGFYGYDDKKEQAANLLFLAGQGPRDANGNPTFTTVSNKIPSYQVVTPGGDTSLVANFEYRVPIFGPVTLAAFFDAGMNRLVNTISGPS